MKTPTRKAKSLSTRRPSTRTPRNSTARKSTRRPKASRRFEAVSKNLSRIISPPSIRSGANYTSTSAAYAARDGSPTPPKSLPLSSTRSTTSSARATTHTRKTSPTNGIRTTAAIVSQAASLSAPISPQTVRFATKSSSRPPAELCAIPTSHGTGNASSFPCATT